ncbi:MAG: hypothetical protein ACOCXA_05085 [Planctomycetota bacterium]
MPTAETVHQNTAPLLAPRDRALRIASMAAVVVLVLLLSLYSRGYASGSAHVGTVVLTIIALRGDQIWQRFSAVPHLLALLPLSIGLFGLCASNCGGLSYYEQILGIPTELLAVLVHAGVGFILASRLLDSVIEDWLITLAVGGSLVFLAVLIGHGAYCATCTSVHALMIAQGILLLMHRRDLRVLAWSGWILAWAGLLNAIFHHQPQPAVRNDPEQLLDYLTTVWSSESAPQRLISTPDPGAPSRIEPEASGTDLISEAIASSMERPQPENTPQVAPAQPAREPVIGFVGDPQAPVLLRVNLDFGCDACGAFFNEIRSLQDLIDDGQVQLEFLFSYNDTVSQAASTIAYASGAESEALFLRVCADLFDKQSILNSPEDCILAVREHVRGAELKQLIGSHREAIGELLTRTERIRMLNGSGATPTAWLHNRQQNEPLRSFSGYVSAAAVRLAIDTVNR